MGTSSVKISVVTALYGERYKQYLARWWDSIKELNRQPDEIVLATSNTEDFGLFDSVPDWCTSEIVKVRADSSGVHGPWYAGAREATGDWIFSLGIDDQFMPEAFDEVQHAENEKAQIIIDRITFLQGGEWPANWLPEKWRMREFAPGGVGGYHKSLKHFWDLMPQDLRWNDHAFYLLCLKENVRIYRATTTRMIHDLGYNHQTVSGINRDVSKDSEAQYQMAAFIESLGL